MAVTSITQHYYTITNKFENLHALQRKINTRSLLPDARPSRPILAVKKVTYIQALRLNTCRNEDIYERKCVHIANFEVDLCSSSVEYCSLSNRKRFSCVCISGYKHERGWENSKQLCKPQTKSIAFIKLLSREKKKNSCLEN